MTENGDGKPSVQFLDDCRNLSATDLRLRYPREYSSWKNVKQRCKRGKGQLDPSFERFVDFLRYMGPKPSPDQTVDRRDRNNPLYGPATCRWATAVEQANNRSSTIYFQIDGEEVPLTTVARSAGISSEALRARVRRGSLESVMTKLIGSGALSDRDGVPIKALNRVDRTHRARLEKDYLDRPVSLEGESRADFAVGQAQFQIGLRHQIIRQKRAMLDFLVNGSLPSGETPVEMEMRLQEQFAGMSYADLEASIQSDEEFIAAAETEIMNERRRRNGGGWSKRSGVLR